MSRKLYDLCRKYKYFYNKHNDVRKWNSKYHDIDLSDAVTKTKVDLGLVEHEIQMELFDVFDVMCVDMEITNDLGHFPFTADRFGSRCHPYQKHSNATIELKDSNRFINVLTDYLQKKYWSRL